MNNHFSDIIYTRYLYIKDEVRVALLVSILNKSDDAIFWGYELYYSGFQIEFFELIVKIYYDFFATLNPSFEQYLLQKKKYFTCSTEPPDNDGLVSELIQDLLFRPFNTDIFLIRNIAEHFEIDITYYEQIENEMNLLVNLRNWIKNNDYRSIIQWIYNDNKIEIIKVYTICLELFEEEGVKLTKDKLVKNFGIILKLNSNPNLLLVVKIISLFSKKAKLKKGKRLYINANPEDIIPYETIFGSNELKSYKILEKVYICGINDLNHLSLFKLNRNIYNLEEFSQIYYYNWEYYAYFSPLWKKRITEFGGYIDNIHNKIVFKEDPDDELMQRFYELYGLEPDEQTKSVQEKSIGAIEKKYDWKWFYEKYRKNGLFNIYDEELEEFDEMGLIY